MIACSWLQWQACDYSVTRLVLSSYHTCPLETCEYRWVALGNRRRALNKSSYHSMHAYHPTIQDTCRTTCHRTYPRVTYYLKRLAVRRYTGIKRHNYPTHSARACSMTSTTIPCMPAYYNIIDTMLWLLGMPKVPTIPTYRSCHLSRHST